MDTPERSVWVFLGDWATGNTHARSHVQREISATRNRPKAPQVVANWIQLIVK